MKSLIKLMVMFTVATCASPGVGEVLQTIKRVSPPPQKHASGPRMEVVFVLDTTGSMGGMLAGAKQKIWAIANKLKSAEPTPAITFGLVAFRDRGDSYVTLVTQLTDDIDAVYQQLFALHPGGGGDTPESVNEALHRALYDVRWSDDRAALRVMFLVGDAPPQMNYHDDVKYAETCRIARDRGIVINTLQCGRMPETEKVWREIARLTGGSYSALEQNGGSVRISTPFDAEIVRLNAALDATIVPYGTEAERVNVARSRAMLSRMASEGVADRAAFLGKLEPGAVLSGKGDLVLEVISDRFSLSSIDPQKLDPRFRNMFAAEREDVILRLADERRALQEQLGGLLRQRAAVVAEQLAARAGSDALELSAFEVLETQAGRKGFRFGK